MTRHSLNWADEWQLSVSIDKCGVLYVGKGVCSAPQPVSYTHLTLPTNREV